MKSTLQQDKLPVLALMEKTLSTGQRFERKGSTPTIFRTEAQIMDSNDTTRRRQSSVSSVRKLSLAGGGPIQSEQIVSSSSSNAIKLGKVTDSEIKSSKRLISDQSASKVDGSLPILSESSSRPNSNSRYRIHYILLMLSSFYLKVCKINCI